MKSIRFSRKLLLAKAATCGLFAFLAASVAQSADERGKQLYNNCIACHGLDGNGNKLLNAPAISGLSEKYTADQLKKFKLGHRGGDVRDSAGMQMRPMSMTLTSDEDIQAVAKYIAVTLKPEKPVAKPALVEGGNVEKGKMLYATCQACHGPDGSGNDMLNAPSLVGQHDWYLEKQLHNFKEGIRGSNPQDMTGAQMRPMAMILADEQAVKDVVAYIQSLAQ